LVTLVITVACWLFFYGLLNCGLQLPFSTGALSEWVRIDSEMMRNLWAG
jgi:hypothetical protein